MDSITKGQRNLLLFILGIAILVVPIRFFAMDNFGAKKDLESQKNERQTYYNELKAVSGSYSKVPFRTLSGQYNHVSPGS